MVYEIITGEKWDFTLSATHDAAAATATATATTSEGGIEIGTVVDTLTQALYKYFNSEHAEEEEG